MNAVTNEIFIRGDAGGSNYTLGSLFAEADSGESLLWNANTGDAATWHADLSTSEGTVS